MINIKNNHFAFELTILHINFILSIFLINYYTLKFKTILLNLILFSFSEISITGGYHRLWSHKSYKASKLLEIFYLFFGTMASQSNVLKWARDHRTHHRCEENDGDPYNINNGFWHAHIWWLFNDYDILTKDQLIITDKLYMDDLKNNNLLYENYWHNNTQTSKHISWSVAKSFLSALIGIALDQGLIESIDDPVTKYLDDFKGTGYEGVPIKDLLQMSSGIKFNEDYADYNSDINRFGRTISFGTPMRDFAKSLENE